MHAKGKNIDPRPIVLGTRLTWSQSSLLCLQMWKGRSDPMQCICLKISLSMSRLVDRSKVSLVKAKSIFCSLNTLKFSVKTQSEPQNGFEFDLARPRLYPNTSQPCVFCTNKVLTYGIDVMSWRRVLSYELRRCEINISNEKLQMWLALRILNRISYFSWLNVGENSCTSYLIYCLSKWLHVSAYHPYEKSTSSSRYEIYFRFYCVRTPFRRLPLSSNESTTKRVNLIEINSFKICQNSSDSDPAPM